MADVIVIGGGIVGMSAAYHLAKQQADVLLIDHHHPERATNAGAGILSPETTGLTIDPVWLDFAIACVDYYPSLIQQLEDAGQTETGYATCGELTVAIDDDELEAFNHAREVIFQRQARRGTPSTADLHEITSDEAQQLFPLMAPVKGAIYYRNAARVDARMLTAAMLNASPNLKHREAMVESLHIENGRITGVILGDGELIPCEKVIIAGGAWSAKFGEQLGVMIPVKPQRGQIIHLDLPDVDTTDFPVIIAFHGHYMVPWHDNRIVIGATRENNSGFNPITTAEGMREVLAEGLRVAPGLKNAQFREIRVGLRPSTADNLPVLGNVPGVDNLFLATGHGASGLQLGPYSGKLAADWAMDQPLDTDIAPFSITRFADA